MSTNDTQPITNGELAAAMSAAMSAVASTFSVMVDMPRGVQPVTMTAEDCRHMASLIDSSLGPDSPAALILRRAADQIDPPPAPAEPDLTTPEGWIAEAKRCVVDTEGSDAFGWSAMAMPSWSNERQALSVAWHGASEPYASALAQAYMRSLGWVRP